MKRDEKFSGLIIYHNIEGEFVNGWEYSDGTITHEICDVREALTSRPTTRALVCTDCYTTVLVEKCYYWGPESGEEVTITGRECRYYTEYEYAYTKCELDGIPTGGDDGVVLAEDTNATAGYIPRKGRLLFYGSENIRYTSFVHEMFHLYQCASNPPNNNEGEERRGYMEYERTLYDDILFFVNELKGDWSDYSANWNKKRYEWVYTGYDSENTKLRDDYTKWLSTITNKGNSAYDQKRGFCEVCEAVCKRQLCV